MNHHCRSKVLLVMFSLSVLYIPSAGAQPDVPTEVLAWADMIFYNGKVLTADDQFSVFEAIAVRDGKIMALGTSAHIQRMAGPETQKVDLNRGSVVPGFYEVHTANFIGTHGPYGPIGTIPIPFKDMDSGLRTIKDIVDKAKPGEWVFVDVPINALTFQLNQRLLDTVSPNNPLLVNYALDGVVNTLALATLPPDIPGIRRDEAGKPNGKVAGFAYGHMTYEVVPWPEDLETKLVPDQKRVLEQAAAYGVTSIGGRGSGVAATILHALWQKGELPIRIRFSVDFARMNVNADAYYRRIGNLEGIGDSWFKLGGNTVESIDGTPTRAGVLTRRPKLEEPPNTGAYGPFGEHKYEYAGQGPDWRERSDFNTILIANRYGWNTNDIHARGDASVDTALEAFELANKERPLKGRSFGLAHGDMRRPDQIAKLAEYDAVLSMNPKYFFLETQVPELYKITYGADSLHGMFTIKSMIQAGMKPVIESNFRYATTATFRENTPEGFSYLSLLEKFITRKNEVTGEVYGQEERISREEALWSATNWASRFYRDQHQQGTLEIGKLADLIVLGGDYMTVPEDSISDIPVLMTIVDGKIVYERP